MRPEVIVCVAFAGALVVVGCQHSPATPRPRPATSSHGQRDDITRGEIATMLKESSSAYDLVKRLRPAMLLPRTVTGVEPTAVLMPNERPGLHIHIDDVRVGDVDVLRTIPAQAVASIRWLSPSDASTKYGNGHTAGVIAVTTLTGRW